MTLQIPIIDLHCDLLSYLQEATDSTPYDNKAIGCNIPDMKAGNVKLQVMAIYSATEKGSTKLAFEQSVIFKKLLSEYSNDFYLINSTESLNKIESENKIGMIAAIENAAGICEEDEPIENLRHNLDKIIAHTGKILYIGLTHHTENRFGGGNATNVGLKPDGEYLLNYLHQQKIAIDLSHTSDALANDILHFIDSKKLDIPIIASHSNYRTVYQHARNLTDEHAKEIIKRKGLIGVNFLRAFLNPDDSNAMNDHILKGIQLGAENAICFGADYFFTAHHPDQSRQPFYFQEHENASKYPEILSNLNGKLTLENIEKIAYRNVRNFISELWR